MEISMTVVAHVRSDFPSKFGIPRQAGLVPELRSMVVFEPEFRNPDLLRGLEDFSHIWLLWNFSGNRHSGWSATVRPPRLGGNTRMGVFATRSPFRPNPIGLSCVKLDEVILHSPQGSVLMISGADLMDGTPIFDIKPYVPYADCQPQAAGGFTDSVGDFLLEVDFPPHLLERVPAEERPALLGVLAHDPRPSYQQDPQRIYGLSFGGFNVRFQVDKHRLTVIETEKM